MIKPHSLLSGFSDLIWIEVLTDWFDGDSTWLRGSSIKELNDIGFLRLLGAKAIFFSWVRNRWIGLGQKEYAWHGR